MWQCAKCFGLERGVTDENEAMALILRERPDWKVRNERNTSFAKAQAEQMETFEMCSSKRKARTLTRRALDKVFAPVVHLITRKLRQLQNREELIGERKKLVDRLAVCADPVEMEKLLEEIEEMEAKVEAASKPLGFAGVQSEEERARWQMAAMYSDSWVVCKDSKGREMGGFTTFYLCRRQWAHVDGKDQEKNKCYSLILNKRWDIAGDDPLAANRWYCPLCTGKYHYGWGVLVEILVGTTVYYCLADAPPPDAEDLRAMIMEEQYCSPALPDGAATAGRPGSSAESPGCVATAGRPAATTPEELYNMIPVVYPRSMGLFEQATRADCAKSSADPWGCYKIKQEAYDFLLSLPRWPWDQLWTFATGEKWELAPKKSGKKSKKDRK